MARFVKHFRVTFNRHEIAGIFSGLVNGRVANLVHGCG